MGGLAKGHDLNLQCRRKAAATGHIAGSSSSFKSVAFEQDVTTLAFVFRVKRCLVQLLRGPTLSHPGVWQKAMT